MQALQGEAETGWLVQSCLADLSDWVELYVVVGGPYCTWLPLPSLAPAIVGSKTHFQTLLNVSKGSRVSLLSATRLYNINCYEFLVSINAGEGDANHKV